MKKFILVVTFSLCITHLISANASPPTSLEIKLMQNRIIKGSNEELINFAICEALFDMRIPATCNGVSVMGQLSYFKGPRNMDGQIFEFDGLNPIIFNNNPNYQAATIRLNKIDDLRYRINIKITVLGKTQFDESLYKRYFDFIGNSLFLNKAGVELGAFSE